MVCEDEHCGAVAEQRDSAVDHLRLADLARRHRRVVAAHQAAANEWCPSSNP